MHTLVTLCFDDLASITNRGPSTNEPGMWHLRLGPDLAAFVTAAQARAIADAWSDLADDLDRRELDAMEVGA